MDNLSTKLGLVENNWNKVLEIIKNQVSLPNFRTWFAQTEGLWQKGELTIIVPSAYIKEQLSTKLSQILTPAINEIYGKNCKINYKIDSSRAFKNIPFDESEFDLSPLPQRSNLTLNPKYNMESFVVGLSNNLAYAAAQAVIQNPGTTYNPLFIYGGTGVGKTHLMQGIGNALVKKNIHLKIIYCPLERFMNDFIDSIRSKKMGEFRSKYRNCDLLLVDDVQFVSGRDSTQEEFFHTFNDLQVKNSQIILTSDRPPQEIQKLEGRLASRFQGGLMVDIQLPDFDTRVAILRAKCAERGEAVPDECLTLIAEDMPTNARELEGKLIQIIQTVKLSHQSFTPDIVRNFLGSPAKVEQKVDYKKVLSQINQYFNIKMSDIVGPRRKKELVVPRHLAMYLLYEECKLPYERIGDILGGRDHTTIMHGVGKIQQALGRDRETQKILIEIKQSL